MSRRESLAVFGGAPAFAQPLHVGRPTVADRAAFLERVNAILDRGWLTNHGPEVQELEARIAERVGVEHCVAVNNGTIALCLLVRAAGLRGQVLVPSFTFIATAHALTWEGLEPVFCDIDPQTWNLDADACAAAVTPATSAILGVHLFGRPCDVEALAATAERHGLALLFDAAHGFGCARDGRPVGSFGLAEALSFHATKVFHTFEGGAITTNDGQLASRARLLRNFGFRGYDDVVSLGTNAKMPEVCAAMGLTNLDRFADTLRANHRVFAAYDRGLRRIPGLRLRQPRAEDDHNWHYVVVEVDAPAVGLTRDQLQSALVAENVLARRYFFPGCHAAEPYATRDPAAAGRLPHTLRAASRVLVLPAGPGISEAEAVTVCELLAAIVERPASVAGALARR